MGCTVYINIYKTHEEVTYSVSLKIPSEKHWSQTSQWERLFLFFFSFFWPHRDVTGIQSKLYLAKVKIIPGEADVTAPT